MDLIALATADPTVLPLWGVLLLALGMYPFGMMFGCTPCCAGCDSCEEGSLPGTLTVAISGIPATTLGPPLVTLSFSSCYGSGASGHATTPVQSSPQSNPEDDRGPITAASVTHGGSGYARLGRVEPTVTAEYGGPGSGATFTVTLEAAQDGCDLDIWRVSAIAGSGGTGYHDDEQLQLTPAAGDTAEQYAVARVKTIREEPEITFTVESVSGTGASLTAVFEEIPGTPVTWRLASVTVDDGGDLYVRGDTVTIGLVAGSLELLPATLRLKPAHAEPTVSASASDATGSGAVLSATLSPTTGYDGSPVWEVASIAVSSPGTGYQPFDYVDVVVVDGSQDSWASMAWVESVDEDGGILSVTVWAGGEYYKGGPISEVEVEGGGQYFRDSGTVESVVIDDGGAYYREDASLSPYVAEVTVSASDVAPSDGSGAVLSAVVDDDPESETFGQITAVNVDEGGDGYLAHEVFESCLNRFNGRSIVVQRKYKYWSSLIYPFFPMAGSPDECTYGYTCANIDSCSLEAEAVLVQYRGPDEPMLVNLYLHQRGQVNRPLGGGYLYPAAYGYFVASGNVQDCSDIDITANGLPVAFGAHSATQSTEGATAHVQGGGEYEEVDACRRIAAEDMNALYAEVTWGAFSSNSADAGDGCGWSASVSTPGGNIDTTGQWCEEWKASVPAKVEAAMATTTGFWTNLQVTATNCSESRSISPASLGVARLSDCNWEWFPGGHVCVSVSRQFSAWWVYDNIYGTVTNPVYAGRACSWCYPIIEIPVDDDLIPSGAVVLGEPEYSRGNDLPPYVTFFDDLLSEENVCVNPGPPTITFSVLP